MSRQPTQRQLRRRIRICIWIVIVGLFVSGVTAFPIESELAVIKEYIPAGILHDWISKIYDTLHDVNNKHPYLSYGTDWLAFAHVMLAVLFLGPLRDPKKNIWVIQFGMIACLSILPLAFIAGPIRQIPFFWRLIDCSFGVFGIIPLWLAHAYTKRLRG